MEIGSGDFFGVKIFRTLRRVNEGTAHAAYKGKFWFIHFLGTRRLNCLLCIEDISTCEISASIKCDPNCRSFISYSNAIAYTGSWLRRFGVWKIETRNVLWLVTWEIHDFCFFVVAFCWNEWKKLPIHSVLWMGCARENNSHSRGLDSRYFAFLMIASFAIELLSLDVSKLPPPALCVLFTKQTPPFRAQSALHLPPLSRGGVSARPRMDIPKYNRIAHLSFCSAANISKFSAVNSH